MLALINDILDLSKIEAGQLDVRPEIVPIPRLIDELTATFHPIAKDRGLELTTSVEQAVPITISTDPLRLAQIVKNLLSNALKFTEHGGVSLHLSSLDDNRIAFAVKDTGIGIPQEQQGVIFEAFRQADGTTNRKYGGSGLGLSISRDLARLLGARSRCKAPPVMAVRSRSLYRQFTLPLPQPTEMKSAQRRRRALALPTCSAAPTTQSKHPTSNARSRPAHSRLTHP